MFAIVIIGTYEDNIKFFNVNNFQILMTFIFILVLIAIILLCFSYVVGRFANIILCIKNTLDNRIIMFVKNGAFVQKYELLNITIHILEADDEEKDD